MHSPDPARHFEPAYLSLLEDGRLSARAEQACRQLADRDLRARYCSTGASPGRKPWPGASRFPSTPPVVVVKIR